MTVTGPNSMEMRMRNDVEDPVGMLVPLRGVSGAQFMVRPLNPFEWSENDLSVHSLMQKDKICV
jgi:hypothetical protein